MEEALFDPTVTAGNVLTAASFIIGGFAAFFALRSDVRSLTIRVTSMEKHISKITDVIIADARHEERLQSHAERFVAQEHRMRHIEERVGSIEQTRHAQRHN